MPEIRNTIKITRGRSSADDRNPSPKRRKLAPAHAGCQGRCSSNTACIGHFYQTPYGLQRLCPTLDFENVPVPGFEIRQANEAELAEYESKSAQQR